MPVVHPIYDETQYTPIDTEHSTLRDALPVADRTSDTRGPTPVDPGGRRRRGSRLLAGVAAMLAVVVGAGLLTSCESLPRDRASVIAQVNASRTAAGLRPLAENGWLDLKADKWAQHMRDMCAISHSKLSDGAPGNWRKLGENVGRGGSVEAIHVAYMNSPSHRNNILNPEFSEIGAAAVWGSCPNSQGVPVRTLFTIHVFMAS